MVYDRELVGSRTLAGLLEQGRLGNESEKWRTSALEELDSAESGRYCGYLDARYLLREACQ